MGWADAARQLLVMTNADNPRDAQQAVDLGAVLYPDCTNINTKKQFKNHNKTKKQHFHIISLKATLSLPYKEALSYQFPQLLPMGSQES